MDIKKRLFALSKKRLRWVRERRMGSTSWIARLNAADEQLVRSETRLYAIQASSSWEPAVPLLSLGRVRSNIARTGRRLSVVKTHEGGVGKMLHRCLALLGESGPKGVRQYLKRTEAAVSKLPEFDRNNYGEWLRKYDTMTDTGRAALVARVAGFTDCPLISIVMPTYNPKLEWLNEAIDSILGQTYPHWELCIVDDASTDSGVRELLECRAGTDPRIKLKFRETSGHICASSNDGLAMASGPWVALLDHDDILRENALFWVADAISGVPDAKIIYSDEDKLDLDGQRFAPYFKPDWNEELFLSHNLINHLGVFRADLVREVGGFRPGFEGSQDYDLALRCVERIEKRHIHHIPRVLCTWRVREASTAESVDAKPYALLAGQRALNEHFARRGIKASAEFNEFSQYRVRYELPAELPLVTIVIPTRNALNLVRQCIESIRGRTTYPSYEILLVDNGSDDPQALHYFQKLKQLPDTRVLRDDRSFNYSALNNAAVDIARGELICLLNNDIEVISPNWLTELVSIGLQPGVGAVGARLWYPNDTLQHGGVIVGVGGVAGHSHKNLPRGKRGFFGRAALIQSLTAVTGACLLVRKSVYQEVGGLDETNLKVAFNDVDLCLKFGEAGYRNVWTPYAELYHHESATRGVEDTPEKKQRFLSERRFMLDRWRHIIAADPAYSPNLTLSHEDFSLAWPPRVHLLG